MRVYLCAYGRREETSHAEENLYLIGRMTDEEIEGKDFQSDL